MNNVGFAQQKKPAGYAGGGDLTCNANNVRGAPSWSCKDPKTGKTLRVKCKILPKQKMPPKMTMAKLKKACRLLDGLEGIGGNR